VVRVARPGRDADAGRPARPTRTPRPVGVADQAARRGRQAPRPGRLARGGAGGVREAPVLGRETGTSQPAAGRLRPRDGPGTAPAAAAESIERLLSAGAPSAHDRLAPTSLKPTANTGQLTYTG